MGEPTGRATPGRAGWSELERLYHAAFERNEPERAAFLREACGENLALRHEVESLLARADDEQFLASPPLDALAAMTAAVDDRQPTLAEPASADGDEHPVLTAGTVLGPYTIVSFLGAGGMGEVYRAHDTRLQRDVALKVLPGTLADDVERRSRLLREARAAAALNHPNICTVHEVGEVDGRVFIALELIDGRSLRSRIADGPLPVADVARIAAQLSDAVAHAHARGIVHRDLKSANVMVTGDGSVKVLDFGLAKRVMTGDAPTAAGYASLTESGVVVGTVPYMSPEQLRGLPADARTDVWAIGVIVYEMLAGKLPFEGRTRFELSSAILHLTPAPLPDAPEDLRQVTLRCLEKEPDRRYQRADEIGAALRGADSSAGLAAASRELPARARRVSRRTAVAASVVVLAIGAVVWATRSILGNRVTGGAPPIRSVAVLPLDNLSGNRDEDYFVTGLHEALITDLARIGVQKVIAKASADAFKGSTKPLSEIGSALGVEGLVTGSVLRANDRIRITVQLVRAATGEVVWANRYERSAGDVLALQNDIVGAIAKEVQSKVDAARSRPAATARALNPAAHDAYLKGRSLDAQFAASQWDRPHFDTVIAQFEEAVRLDPTYAPPYAAISMDFQKSSQMSLLAPTESLPRAKAAALKAVELDDGLPEAHAALAGVYLWFDWNWSAAERELRRALDLNPNAFDVLVMSEVFSVLVAGNIDDAVRTSQRVLDIDPLNPFSRIQTVWVAIGARRHDEVVRRARALLDVWPGLMMGQWFLAIDFASQGKRAETEAECGSVMKMLGGAYNMQIVATCAWAYGAVGRHDEARRLLAIVEQPPPGSWLDPAFMGNAYGPLDPDRAFAWYEKGLEQRSPNMIYMKAGMTWDSTRSDPRFPALLRRMNYPN